jgi:hypothetical protein
VFGYFTQYFTEESAQLVIKLNVISSRGVFHMLGEKTQIFAVSDNGGAV